MILGLISIVSGISGLIYLWPISLDSFNSIATLIILISLIGFGARIFIVDFKVFLNNKKERDRYFETLKETLSLGKVPNYPNKDVIKNPRVLKKVVELIKTKQIQDAKPILNHDIAFKGAQIKFMFFSWLFKENDTYRVYRQWKKIYKKINAATYSLIVDLVNDLKEGSYLVDITNTKSQSLSPGSYVLKLKNDSWVLNKIPIHSRYIVDDFYGSMIYDHSIDQMPYQFKTNDILTKKERHIKQTTNFFLDIEGKRYKKTTKSDIKCFKVKLKNQESFDLIGHRLPI